MSNYLSKNLSQIDSGFNITLRSKVGALDSSRSGALIRLEDARFGDELRGQHGLDHALNLRSRLSTRTAALAAGDGNQLGLRQCVGDHRYEQRQHLDLTVAQV